MTPVAKPPVVAVAQHDRQRDQAHRDHRGRDHAGGRGEQRADEDHRVGEAAAHRPEQLADRVEQVLGHAAALEDQSHEGEERHREQRVVRHDAADALGQRLQQRGLQQPELDADQAEQRCRRRRARRRPGSRAAARRSAPTNISGAMFAIRKAVMRCSRRGMRLGRSRGSAIFDAALARDLLGKLLLRGFAVLLERVRESVPCRKAMRLMSSEMPCTDQQEEADRHQQPRRPDDQPAGIGRYSRCARTSRGTAATTAT